MTDKNDPCGNDRPDALRKPLSRRSFLRGVGALPFAALAPAGLSAGNLETAATEAAAGKLPPVRPLLGALFNPYHRPEDWSLLGPRPEGMPLLGSYASDAVGSVATQIIWAKMMGVSFFLAAYSPGKRSRSGGLDALFEAAGRSGYTVGLYIDLQDHAGRPSQPPPQVQLAAALEQIASRYLPHPEYLRAASGLPVLAVAGLDDGGLLDATLLASGHSKVWGPVLRLPAAWRAIPDAQVAPESAQAVDRGGPYLGFSVRQETRAVSRRIPCHSQAASAVLVSPASDEAGGIQLPKITVSPTGPAYIILDSFNHWGVSVPLEPGTISGTKYARHVAQWSRGQAV